MQALSKQTIIENINAGVIFSATIEDGSFSIKIDEYVPYCCFAIHSGDQLRGSLQNRCALTKEERFYEEDPVTHEFISSLPITVVAHASRYEVDLNRSTEKCIYDKAWGKQVWASPLSEDEKALSLAKHRSFYEVVDSLIAKLLNLFKKTVVYDIHSYNYKRREEFCPVFNLGTHSLDTVQWSEAIDYWKRQLKSINLPNIETTSEQDLVFQGKGYLAQHIGQRHKNVLTLATEIKKIYMNELTGESYPMVIEAMREGLKGAILNTTTFFLSHYNKRKKVKKLKLLSQNIDPEVLRIDRQLYAIAKGVETLLYINPVNIQSEKRRFFSKSYNYNPQFRYRQLAVDAFKFRESIYRIDVDKIEDISIQKLYRDVIDSYANKIDLLTTIGTDRFLYNSLRYYGEPNKNDIRTANFILYAPEFEEEQPRILRASNVISIFKHRLKEYSFNCKIEESNKIVANAMVNGRKKSILINKNICVSKRELNGLIHHELGVHMVTTMNADSQSIHIFKLGLPGNTWTQEGLAILSEYLASGINLSRLRVFALRVIAVQLMIDNYSFSQTFKELVNLYEVEPNLAFTIAARVYRGGGFTKDYLYLKGLKDALHYYQKRDIKNIFIGKTSFNYLDTIDELIGRGVLRAPEHLPVAFSNPVSAHPILDYLISAIK